MENGHPPIAPKTLPPLASLPETQRKNLEFWYSVMRTDPDFTKRDGYGKRTWTSIDPAYRIYEITKVWGPCGGRWHYTPTETVIQDPITGNTVIMVRCEFHTPLGEHPIVQYSSAKLFNNGNINEDAPKIACTGAFMKCLYIVGLQVDVYLGQFDDEDYVAYQKEVQDGIKSEVDAGNKELKDPNGPVSEAMKLDVLRVCSAIFSGNDEQTKKYINKSLRLFGVGSVSELSRGQAIKWMANMKAKAKSNGVRI